ncbi:hypothetical protein NDU88_001641 [Pleurodeles waltl]|uniref:Uncharacterized protein n=1 Tax=Pleurodeles waltl TaxID=8319 RepID=A0AAV7W026_PLEWA|nr:hypothetical protein NDU88_001641 [Pleurodeles waltl]
MLSVTSPGKTSHQLLFLEILSKQCPLAIPQASSVAGPTAAPPSLQQNFTMTHILQEVTVIGCLLEGIDSKISNLMAETKSIRADIADFQDRVEGMEQCFPVVEDRLNAIPDRDQELLYLRNKPTDLEDKSHRDKTYALATLRTESGTESRLSLHGDALPGRHGNIDNTSLTGNPDIRVPKALKIDNGLHAQCVVEEEEDAERAEETPKGGFVTIEETSNQREAPHPNTKDRIEAREEIEKRELRHVPGGQKGDGQSGTESRFSLNGNALLGRHGNIDNTSLTGNPDIWVPKALKIDDGLRSRRVVEEEEDAERAGETPKRRLCDNRRNIESERSPAAKHQRPN